MKTGVSFPERSHLASVSETSRLKSSTRPGYLWQQEAALKAQSSGQCQRCPGAAPCLTACWHRGCPQCSPLGTPSPCPPGDPGYDRQRKGKKSKNLQACLKPGCLLRSSQSRGDTHTEERPQLDRKPILARKVVRPQACDLHLILGSHSAPKQRSSHQSRGPIPQRITKQLLNHSRGSRWGLPMHV